MSMLPHKLRAALPAGFALLALTAESAPAQRLAPPPPRYDLRLAPALAGIGVASGAWLAARVFRDDLPHATCAPCDPAGLPGIDRAILGPVRSGLSSASNATLLVTVGGAGALLLAADGPREERFADAVVFAQAVSATAALEAWSKVAFHRPRPVRYTADAAAPLRIDDGLSFPSGHASLAFAAAAAYASIAHRRGATGRRTVTALLFAAATTTAVLRVTSRRHFPTDVAAGALMGGVVGWVVPAVYPER